MIRCKTVLGFLKTQPKYGLNCLNVLPQFILQCVIICLEPTRDCSFRESRVITRGRAVEEVITIITMTLSIILVVPIVIKIRSILLITTWSKQNLN